jgi:4,5-dihydroxyphthalate decarboxylase
MSEPLVLKTALDQHAHVKPLRDGRVSSPRVRFDFHDFSPLPKAFRRMVREGDLDVSEMAVANHILAVDHGKPITGLAIPLWSRLPYTNLVRPVDSPVKGPKDLEGGRVGVRAYAQTSGVWVRGLLKTEYGVDLDSIRWITMEDAHVAEYSDPPGVERNTAPGTLREIMVRGELLAIMGERIVDPAGVTPVIADGEAEAKRWIEKTRITPINHTLAVKTELLATHPWLAAELSELFDKAREIAIAEDGATPPPLYGLEACRGALQMLLDFCADQRVTSRRYDVDEVYVDPAKGLDGLRAAQATEAAA